MAEIESLGVHSPAALEYLISEGVLPQDPHPSLYQWETYIFSDGHSDIEEELLATTACVVWSQGRFIRNVYRFELEGEPVQQALLTSFPQSFSATADQSLISEDNKIRLRHNRQHHTTGIEPAKQDSQRSHLVSRALVVFLRTKAHVYFLHGSSHIIDLPFPVERAFAAPQGILLQRKPSTASDPSSSPQVPRPPPNSFWSSQLHPSSSILQSPTLAKSFGTKQRPGASPFQLRDPNLAALHNDVFGASGSSDEDDPSPLYSLTSPFAGFGVVTWSLQRQKPRFSGKDRPTLTVEFEELDAAERLIYVSPYDELKTTEHDCLGPLVILVTVNEDLNTLNFWHAWYIVGKPLHALLRQHELLKLAKSRRRSSFLSAGVGTGATTPAVRQRDGLRESFAPVGSIRLPAETAEKRTVHTTSRKPTRQEEEEAMASRMDPDFVPVGSQQMARESRRISSLNADVRASQAAGAAGYAGHGARRTTSFGIPAERKSFSRRKSRGSTPGSTFSRSLDLDDDLMELDYSSELDDGESTESILLHIKATLDAAGTDSVFGNTEGDFQRELVVRKLHSITMRSHSSLVESFQARMRVEILRDAVLLQDGEEERLNIYVHDGSTKELYTVRLAVKQAPFSTSLQDGPVVAIPRLAKVPESGKCENMVKLKDEDAQAVLLQPAGIIYFADQTTPCSVPASKLYRMYRPFDVSPRVGQDAQQMGRNRLLRPPDGSITLGKSGPKATYDEIDNDGKHHRRRVRLRPRDSQLYRMIDVCRAVLPLKHSRIVLPVWCTVYAFITGRAEHTGVENDADEWLALVTTIFVFTMHLVNEKARAALNISRMATGNAMAATPLSMAMQAEDNRHSNNPALSWMRTESMTQLTAQEGNGKEQILITAATVADELLRSASLVLIEAEHTAIPSSDAVKLMIALHVFREEQRLSVIPNACPNYDLAPVIAQLGAWLGLTQWSFGEGRYYDLEGASEAYYSFSKPNSVQSVPNSIMPGPISVYQWLEHIIGGRSGLHYPSIAEIAAHHNSTSITTSKKNALKGLTPRTTALSGILLSTGGLRVTPSELVEAMGSYGVDYQLLDSLPSGIAAPFHEAIARCGGHPPSTWDSRMLELVGREDLDLSVTRKSATGARLTTASVNVRDVQSICQALDYYLQSSKTREASRNAVSQLIFNEDRRLVEATSMMHFNTVQVAECPKQPDWNDAMHFEQQRRVMNWATTRMIALPAGDAMVHFDSQTPMLTEKYPLPGFNSSCLMQPMAHTLTTDRAGLTEEKVYWAYFHAGVSMGLRISRHVQGIDTSWIAFNKPTELTNRHAGLLLALGLSGHLRSLAKWLAFKYLTPKHMMTSVGLLLGLSASYMGTMDGLITRMLSVHITRMLPPGAVELNVSPLTQTAGLMGVGLLYYDTQHRRMSEIMLSEIENIDLEDPDSGPDQLRDESYRLAAGFALGFINLAKGSDLHGLHGMRLPERLLGIAVGPRAVNTVHVFDRATAGAIIAIMLVYMKSGHRSIAQRIDIPDTEAQYEHVRPDMLLLRVVAKHIILWEDIQVFPSQDDRPKNLLYGIPTWIQHQLPSCYKTHFARIDEARGRYRVTSADVPFLNIVTGLAWAISLKYAGSANIAARDEVLAILWRFTTVGTDSYYYDAKLARSSLRRCVDVLALSAATIMAGTGDLQTFRHLRRLHGRTDAETPYGSHLAAHLAIGALFLGGGTYTFGTSNLATAALICAFYPLFPNDVHDNYVHLQAFRHFWVLAAEARCIVVEDVDFRRPISIPIIIRMKDGSTRGDDASDPVMAPCVLPDLDMITSVETNDPVYWPVKLDFVGNPQHLAVFRQNQSIHVRRRPASEAHASSFSATLAAQNAKQFSDPAFTTPSLTIASPSHLLHILFSLPSLKALDKTLIELILPPEPQCSAHMDHRGTVVDDRLALTRAIRSNDRNILWNLRILFTWADRARQEGHRLRYLGEDVIEDLRASIEERVRTTAGD